MITHPTVGDLHRDLVDAVEHWTLDPDRADMQDREHEVARSLYPAVAAELARLAHTLGAYGQLTAADLQARARVIRAAADEQGPIR